MGPDGIFEQAFIDAAGPAAEGTYITFGGVPPSKLTGAGATWYAELQEAVQRASQRPTPATATSR